MPLSKFITKAIDIFYVKPLQKVFSQQVFRYLACGAITAFLDAVWYYLIYHHVVCERVVTIGNITMLPHIAALCTVFPITFFTGFLLNRHVAFHATQQQSGKQLKRYALSVLGSIVINYVCMKLFVEYFNIWPTPSKLLTTIVTVAYSFVAAKYFTFRNQKDK